jgi:DNA-binding response OmpR family regulator
MDNQHSTSLNELSYSMFYLFWIQGSHHSTGKTLISDLRQIGYQIDVFNSGKAALDALQHSKPDATVLDAQSLGTTGTRLCQALHDAQQIVFLLASPDREAPSPAADETLIYPFTLQKLKNRLQACLANGKERIQAGPITLYPDPGRVECYGRTTFLTPRAVKLLMLLIENRNQAVRRDWLFSKVWDTHYVEDTRSLDVHIRWIRQAIEEDSHSPRLLKTLRGFGFILSCDEVYGDYPATFPAKKPK